MKSGYGKDMVLVVPFTGEIRLQSIELIGGTEGDSPNMLKVYKNEENVDINIQEEKKPVQTFDLVEGGGEYPTDLRKFSSVSSLVLGFDGTFGASKSLLHFIGFKGKLLRMKFKPPNVQYELLPALKDVEQKDEDTRNFMNLGT